MSRWQSPLAQHRHIISLRAALPGGTALSIESKSCARCVRGVLPVGAAPVAQDDARPHLLWHVAAACRPRLARWFLCSQTAILSFPLSPSHDPRLPDLMPKPGGQLTLAEGPINVPSHLPHTTSNTSTCLSTKNNTWLPTRN